MSEYGAPFVSIRAVEDAWIGSDGHLDVAAYGVLFDRVGDEALVLVGLGADYLAATNSTYFTMELHFTYARPLGRGDHARVTVQLLDYDAKRIHYIQEMFHATEGWLAATMEAMFLHVDMAAKRSSPFPPAVLEKLAAMHAAHKHLPVPPQVGHRIAVRR